jgi:hypothetical protein
MPAIIRDDAASVEGLVVTPTGRGRSSIDSALSITHITYNSTIESTIYCSYTAWS